MTDYAIAIFQGLAATAGIVIQWHSTAPDTRKTWLLLVRLTAIGLVLGGAGFACYRASVSANNEARLATMETTLQQVRAYEGDPQVLQKYLQLVHQMGSSGFRVGSVTA
jgi:hypothetical protein